MRIRNTWSLEVRNASPSDPQRMRLDAVQTTLLPAIQNAELKALVVKVAPAFQAHMLAAQNLEQKLSGKASAPNQHGH